MGLARFHGGPRTDISKNEPLEGLVFVLLEAWNHLEIHNNSYFKDNYYYAQVLARDARKYLSY